MGIVLVGERCSKLCLFPSRRGHRVGRLTRAVQDQSPIYSRLFRSKRYDSATNPNGLLKSAVIERGAAIYGLAVLKTGSYTPE